MASARDVVLLSTADWDNPFWTNKQHVARVLNENFGFKVLYIESPGLRRISATRSDGRRIVNRIARAFRRPREAGPGLFICAPILLPWHGLRIVQLINRLIFLAQLKTWMKVCGVKRDLLWSYYPLTCRLVNVKNFKTVIYHCVDEIKEQPGMPRQEIAKADAELTRAADVCFVTSRALLQSRQALNNETYYFPNVADFGHFSRALTEEGGLPDDLSSIPSPRIGFIGAISSYKLDLPLLRYIAEKRPHWNIVMIGKIGEGEPWTNISEISHLSNVHLIGPRSYDVLPNYLRGMSAAILPCALNEYTESMFPMKFFEYLAAGRSVVSTRLPALAGYEDVAEFADDPEAFLCALEKVLSCPKDIDLILKRAKDNTYVSRTERMLEVIRRSAP